MKLYENVFFYCSINRIASQRKKFLCIRFYSYIRALSGDEKDVGEYPYLKSTSKRVRCKKLKANVFQR